MSYPKPLFVVGVVVGFSAPALAAKPDSRAAPADQATVATKEAKERAAKKACLNGDPTKGVELLTDLYVDSNEPTYIFNQGRCYEQNNRCEDAIVRFREYLRKTVGGNANDRADVQKHITDCEALLAKQKAEAAVPAVAAAAPSSVTPVASAPVPVPLQSEPPLAAVPPPAVALAQPQTVSSPGSALRGAGLATMAVGGAALIAGVVLNLKHNSTIHDLKSDYRGDLADDAETYKTVSMVGYGVGAACLLGGSVLYWLGWRAGNTVLAPAVVAGNAGVVATGGF